MDILTSSIVRKLKTEKYESSVYSHLLDAIGEISNLDGKVIENELEFVVPILLRAVQDQSSAP